MVAEAYPFVARKVLRNNSLGAAALLREMLYDPSTGGVRTTRLSAMLNAALGYVADETGGFVDFDAVPEQGASFRELLQFLLSPGAADLRPLLLAELTNGTDLLLRDRLRRAAAGVSTLAPRLPFFGTLPLPRLPALLLPVPGRGLLPAGQLVDELAPALSQPEEVYLKTLTELAASLLGVQPAELEAPDAALLSKLLLSPNEQVRELQQAFGVLLGGGSGGSAASSGGATGGGVGASGESATAVREMTAQVVDALMGRAAQRLSVEPDTLFPMRGAVLTALQ